MKHLTLLLLAFICAMPLSNAQLSVAKVSPDTFRIQKFPPRYWFKGEKMRKPKQMESILLAKKDPQINRDWQAVKTTRSIGTGVMVLGLVLEAVGLYKQIKGDESGANLVLGGAGVILGGVFIQTLANPPIRRVTRRFNDLEMGRTFPLVNPPKDDNKQAAQVKDNDPKPSNDGASLSKKKSDPDSEGPRIALRMGLNTSKLWEIGGSKELRSDEKIWWAKSLPVALSYELPGSTPGQGFSFELALLSKGFREKTETTNTGSSIKSRSDLQLRFLQLAAMKKLPLGSQTKKLRFHAQGGVFVGYATSARTKFHSRLKDEDTKRWVRQITELEFGDEFGQLNAKRFDAGLLAGAGVSYPAWCGRIVLDARFSVGAMNLEKTKIEGSDLKLPSLHTRDFTILVGYSVPLSK